MKNRNGAVAFSMAALVAAMLGTAYAAVPLYKLFCKVTGFAGTPRRAYKAPTSSNTHLVRVHFDANVNMELPWTFGADQSSVLVTPGEPVTISYHARNNAAEPITGKAVFNVTPAPAAPFFNKLQCFCFTRQLLKPGESKVFPVTLFIDPAMAKDPLAGQIQDITLSYTFYKAHDQLVATNSVSTKVAE